MDITLIKNPISLVQATTHPHQIREKGKNRLLNPQKRMLKQNQTMKLLRLPIPLMDL